MKFVFLFLFGCINAAKILIMLPSPMYSHTKNFLTVFKELAKRGHNVTCVSPYPQNTKLKNWNDIVVRNTLQDLLAAMGNIDMTETDGMWFDLTGTWWFSMILFELVVQEEPVQKVIKDTSSYDLIITESFFAHEPFLALGHKFNAPVISINAYGITPTIAHYTGNDFPSAYLPNRKILNSDKMSFLERAKNTFYTYWEIYGANLYYIPKMDSLMRKHIVYPGSENLPHLSDLLRNSSLVLVESHLGLHYPRPLHRNVIEIGGINLKGGDKLPEDLKAIMDNASHGVIYFSFGSAFNFTKLEESKQNEIISALGKVKQKIIMKYEEEKMPNQPKNVYIRKWLPQATILGHPNCKLFITHGGLHGLMESLYQGVPLVAIPLFSDQKFNAKFVETIGAGEMVLLHELAEQKLLNAINKVLSEKSYKENAELRKRIFRDNPISQMDNAVYWIEYILKFKGAPHLRPASLDLPWYQRHLLDVFLFFTALTLLFITSIIILIKLIKLSCNFVKPKTNKKMQ